MTNQCDVVVIGGGPGGSTAATLIAQKGWQVTLLDKQQHPRYTVGESLIPDFWKFLDESGATEKILAANFVQKCGGMVNWQGEPKAHTFKDFGYDRPAMHVERDEFDNILLRHAESEGVQVCEGYHVTKVDFETTPTTVHYHHVATGSEATITCQYVIDASGQSAVLGNQLKVREFDDSFRFMSIWGYFTNAKYLSIDGKAYPHERIREVPPVTYVTSLDGEGDNGWCWYIAMKDKTSVGLVFPNKRMKELKADEEDWETFFRRICHQTPIVSEMLGEASFVPDGIHITRDYSYQSTKLAGPGYFLIGDAAGFVDPIFSVGIVLSLYSAYAVAWAVDNSLKNPALAAVNAAIFEKQLRGRLEVARSLALPRYQGMQHVSEDAKRTLQLESTHVKKLMQTASSLTSRSDNFLAMTDGGYDFELNEYQLRTVEKLVLD